MVFGIVSDTTQDVPTPRVEARVAFSARVGKKPVEQSAWLSYLADTSTTFKFAATHAAPIGTKIHPTANKMKQVWFCLYG